MRAVVRAAAHGDEVNVQTNLGTMDACLYPAVFAALGQHLGLDPEPLRKAVEGDGSSQDHEPPDPRYPEITRLIEAARKDWILWGDQLVAKVGELLHAGKLLPMTRANEKVLHELFRDHQVRLVLRMAGTHPDREKVEDLIRRGLVDKGVQTSSYIDVAWKLGRGLSMLEAHKMDRAGSPSLESIVRKAVKYDLTPQDEEAIAYVKRRGAIFMRRPAEMTTSELDRELNDEEYRAIRQAVARGVEQRHDSKRVARELHDALKGNASLQNDMDRVALTELAFAHSHGSYVALKAQAAEVGQDDPWVYKFAGAGACRDCRRIWGPPSDPKRYRLSEIEAREAAGGNFKRPRREWGPVIGPVHPHCTEGPLQYYHPDLVDAINAVAKDYEAWFKR